MDNVEIKYSETYFDIDDNFGATYLITKLKENSIVLFF